MGSAKHDKETWLMGNALEIFHQLDTSGRGQIDWDNFKECIRMPDVVNFFRHVDVDPADAHEIFKMLDKDSSGQMDASEFLTGCITLFGPSRAIDTARILDDLLEVKLWLVSHAEQLAFRDQQFRDQQNGV